MAVILHIETATQVCSVALSASGKILGLSESHEKNIHSSVVTVFIEKILGESGLSFSSIDAVAVSKGPGSYTGLRIGVSTAKGICYAIDRPLIGIGTLQSMATGMLEKTGPASGAPDMETLLCPMIDARRMEVYSELFDMQIRPVREIQAEVITETSFAGPLESHSIWFAGDGAEKCRPLLGHHPNARFLDDFNPSATYMVRLAEDKFSRSEFEDVAYFEPFYLKDFIPGIPKVKGLRF